MNRNRKLKGRETSTKKMPKVLATKKKRKK